ncbi:MAG: N-acetylmuramoyl-L-alanine amidase [Eubacteriales bacterium]|nr:N-acetylmuramoyl-L-alanine amidase [Eubacteriales bacterium]
MFAIEQQYLTQNPTYTKPNKITPAYVVIHSTATPGLMAAAWPPRWNKADVEKSIHYFVDDTTIINTLPEDYWGWHCGKPINSVSVGMEICEPRQWKTDSAYFNAAWQRATWLAAQICSRWDIPAENVLGHYEAYAKGLSNSNHADPSHWFPFFGKNMNLFRADVSRLLSGEEKGQMDAWRDTILRTVAAEARGEPYDGQRAVAQCIRDRANDAKQRFGKGLQGVLRQGQFAAPWQGDLSTVPNVARAVQAVFDQGESVYPQPVLWVLGKAARAETVAARDAKYVRLGTIGNQTFWGDEKGTVPTAPPPQNPYALPAITGKYMLRQGSAGDAVRWLQWNLQALGYDLGKWGVDGIFGAQTQLAVKQYQQEHELVADGIVGPKTYATLQ